jgi:hypothetical protein
MKVSRKQKSQHHLPLIFRELEDIDVGLLCNNPTFFGVLALVYHNIIFYSLHSIVKKSLVYPPKKIIGSI